MKYTKNKSDETLIKAGIEKIRVAINFLKPYRFFTNLRTLVTLKILKTLIS